MSCNCNAGKRDVGPVRQVKTTVPISTGESIDGEKKEPEPPKEETKVIKFI